MPQESSAAIALWAESTFGKVHALETLVTRAEKKLLELRAAVDASQEPHRIGHEAADVVILLHRLAALLGYELDVLVDEKMAINRRRRWQPSGDGVGQHQPGS